MSLFKRYTYRNIHLHIIWGIWDTNNEVQPPAEEKKKIIRISLYPDSFSLTSWGAISKMVLSITVFSSTDTSSIYSLIYLSI